MARRELDIDKIFQGLLEGDHAMLGRAITLVESTLDAHRKLAARLLELCMPHTGNSIRVGITGVPGVGKSTFINTFGRLLTDAGEKVAVLAVDPSSQRSHGSILGDKTRMTDLVGSERAFVRPSPSGSSLGGVAWRTREAILLCEAAGFKYILVETVGVGQSEVAVRSMVDFFLLLMLPGAGDELQGIKRGVMEMADLIVINKAEDEYLKKAKIAQAQYKSALHLFPPHENGWIPDVTLCSALRGTGIEEVLLTVKEYKEKMIESGMWEEQRMEQAVKWLMEHLDYLLHLSFFTSQKIKEQLGVMKERVRRQEVPPTVAAEELVMFYLQSKK